MHVTPLTPKEQTYVQTQVDQARSTAAEALRSMREPLAPGIGSAARDSALLRACHDAAEHLYDVDQVDVSAEMVEDVRHALEEIRMAIEVLDRRGRPGVAPPELPADALGRAIDRLDSLEHTLRRSTER